MSKNLVSQVRGVWSASRIFQPGQGRRVLKDAAREHLQAEGLGATSSRIAGLTPVTSYRTFSCYVATSLDFARFAEGLGVRRVQDLRPEHAEAFMRAKLAEGCSCNTLRGYAAGLGKLGVAMEHAPKRMKIPEVARLAPGLDAARRDWNRMAPRLDTERRAYAAPGRLLAALDDPGHRLAGRLQLEAGFRVSETLGLHRGSLCGVTRDPVTGRPCGLVHVVGKGGYGRAQFVPLATYHALADHLEEHAGRMNVGYKPYLAALHRAADAVGETWAGTHALRHNYVQAFLREAAAAGLEAEAAARETMERVGHHRVSELKTYLR